MSRGKRFLVGCGVLTGLFLLYRGAELVLRMHRLSLRNTVLDPFCAIVALLTVYLVYQLLSILCGAAAGKKHRRILRVAAGAGAACVSVLTAVSLLYGPMMFAFWHQREHVVEKDGKQMVAYVDSYVQIMVYYYDYRNALVRGSQLKIMVDGGSGGSDPYADGGEGPYVRRYEYYDDDGNTLATNWAG